MRGNTGTRRESEKLIPSTVCVIAPCRDGVQWKLGVWGVKHPQCLSCTPRCQPEATTGSGSAVSPPLLPGDPEKLLPCDVPHCIELSAARAAEGAHSHGLHGLLGHPSSAPMGGFPGVTAVKQEHPNPFYSNKTKMTVGFSLSHSRR